MAIDGIRKMQLILELQELAERAFIHKLRIKKPDITDEEITAELSAWYKIRPGAEHGDGVGRPGDLSRFD